MKIFRLFLLLPVLFFSCADKYYVTEVTEIIREEVAMNTWSVYYPVSSSNWILMDVPPTWDDPNEDSKWTYFYCDFNEPLLTTWQFNNGLMNAFLATQDGQTPVLTPLPYDDFYKEPSPSSWMWTEQVTCEFSPRNVRFIVKYSDFEVGNRPKSYRFMVRYAW